MFTNQQLRMIAEVFHRLQFTPVQVQECIMARQVKDVVLQELQRETDDNAQVPQPGTDK